MALSSYSASQLIRALVRNGYDGTLVELLRDLDLNKLICDTDVVDNLLIFNTLGNTVETIGIENAIIVFDELSAPTIVDHIINKDTILNKLLEHQIINHRVTDYVHAYNHGYQILVKNTHCVSYCRNNVTTINNAYNNGLFAQYAYVGFDPDNNNIMQCVFDDIRIVRCSDTAATVLCNRAEEILGLTDRTEPLPFAKNIKKLNRHII